MGQWVPITYNNGSGWVPITNNNGSGWAAITNNNGNSSLPGAMVAPASSAPSVAQKYPSWLGENYLGTEIDLRKSLTGSMNSYVLVVWQRQRPFVILSLKLLWLQKFIFHSVIVDICFLLTFW